MKTTQLSGRSAAILLFIILGCLFNVTAQTVQYATLSASNNPASFSYLPLQTNQIVSLVGYARLGFDNYSIIGNLPDGSQIDLDPSSSSAQTQQIVTGLTNIVLGGSYNSASSPYVWATFQITTPASANVVSNYVPADAIVIPSSATGNVQIILESSTDLVNWTAANPGTYGASSATNRFFRVRAVHN